MRQCYYVPGFLGSELYLDEGLTVRLYPEPWRLVLGQIAALRLDADGVGPGPPTGRQLYAGPPLHDLDGVALTTLAGQLAPRGYAVAAHGYDWRLDVRMTGVELARRIRTEVDAAEPCAIVCHSLGGLVARVAWWDLNRTGDAGLVRRIVTLGTPHWGTYYAVRFFVGLSAQLQSIVSSTALALLGIRFPPAEMIAASVIDYVRDVFCTFPSLYQLLPSLLAPSASADPFRGALYDPATWSSRGIPASTAHLDDVRQVWQPFLRGAAALPPPGVLTTVAGTSYSTAISLSDPGRLGEEAAWMHTDDGDEVVAIDDALHDQAGARWLVDCRHVDLVAGLAQDGDIADMVTADVPLPAPPPALLTPPVTPIQTGPPFNFILGTRAASPCSTGMCRC